MAVFKRKNKDRGEGETWYVGLIRVTGGREHTELRVHRPRK